MLLCPALGLLLSTLTAPPALPDAPAQPVTPFADPAGRFTLELPEGFILVPKQNENVYVFQKPDASLGLTMIFVPGLAECERSFESRLNDFKRGLLGEIATGRSEEVEVNGNRARWGVYKGVVEVGESKEEQVGFVGCLALPKGTLSLLSSMSQKVGEQHAKAVEKAFRSIRGAGSELVPPAPTAP